MLLALLPALVVSWGSYDPVEPEVPGVVLALGAGYGGGPTAMSCVVTQDSDFARGGSCAATYSGMALSAGVGVLWGNIGRFGFRVDGSFVPFGNGERSLLGTVLAVARYDRTLVVEGGVGAGYSYLKQESVSKGAGVAGHVLVGFHVSKPLTIFSRVVGMSGEPGGLIAGVGAEWSL